MAIYNIDNLDLPNVSNFDTGSNATPVSDTDKRFAEARSNPDNTALDAAFLDKLYPTKSPVKADPSTAGKGMGLMLALSMLGPLLQRKPKSYGALGKQPMPGPDMGGPANFLGSYLQGIGGKNAEIAKENAATNKERGTFVKDAAIEGMKGRNRVDIATLLAGSRERVADKNNDTKLKAATLGADGKVKVSEVNAGSREEVARIQGENRKAIAQLRNNLAITIQQHRPLNSDQLMTAKLIDLNTQGIIDDDALIEKLGQLKIGAQSAIAQGLGINVVNPMADIGGKKPAPTKKDNWQNYNNVVPAAEQ